MRIISKAALAAIGAMALAIPAGAKERTVPADLIFTDAMVPYLYQYAACVFGGAGADADQRIAACKAEGERLKSEAEAPFVYWHRGKGPTRDRQFARAFKLLDSEARILEQHYGPVPASVTAYMECMGTRLASSDAFRDGRSVDFVAFNQPCRDEAGFSFESASDLERRLFQRVRRTDRVIRNPVATAIAYEFDRGLLGARYF